MVDEVKRWVIEGPAEQGLDRANWLQIASDSGLPTASVLLSVYACARRNHLDPWSYLTHVLSKLPARRDRADMTDLLPNA